MEEQWLARFDSILAYLGLSQADLQEWEASRGTKTKETSQLQPHTSWCSCETCFSCIQTLRDVAEWRAVELIDPTLDIPLDARVRTWLETYLSSEITLPEALAAESHLIFAQLLELVCGCLENDEQRSPNALAMFLADVLDGPQLTTLLLHLFQFKAVCALQDRNDFTPAHTRALLLRTPFAATQWPLSLSPAHITPPSLPLGPDGIPHDAELVRVLTATDDLTGRAAKESGRKHSGAGRGGTGAWPLQGRARRNKPRAPKPRTAQQLMRMLVSARMAELGVPDTDLPSPKTTRVSSTSALSSTGRASDELAWYEAASRRHEVRREEQEESAHPQNNRRRTSPQRARDRTPPRRASSPIADSRRARHQPVQVIVGPPRAAAAAAFSSDENDEEEKPTRDDKETPRLPVFLRQEDTAKHTLADHHHRQDASTHERGRESSRRRDDDRWRESDKEEERDSRRRRSEPYDLDMPHQHHRQRSRSPRRSKHTHSPPRHTHSPSPRRSSSKHSRAHSRSPHRRDRSPSPRSSRRR
eukprot:m.229878 g.229878  ORF g.229878 m.229878 type:complete len:530 (+) comp17866_c0_seq1:680-2269(+)